jgi:hypothetical protein
MVFLQIKLTSERSVIETVVTSVRIETLGLAVAGGVVTLVHICNGMN